MKVEEIARIVGGIVEGDKDIEITGVGEFDKAKEGEITFAVDERKLKIAEQTNASCILIPQNLSSSKKTVIKVKNPRLAFAKILDLFNPYKPKHTGKISKTAIIGENVELGKNVSIMDFVIVEEGSKIGDGVIIYPHCYIGKNVKIGERSILYSGVRIYNNTEIGEGVVIHAGTVLGVDGFGYERDGEGKLVKIPQIGKLVIEGNVEIGANCVIQRGTIGDTVIGEGTKVCDYVVIGHNVVIGKHVIIVGGTAIGGSVVIGDYTTIGGGSVIKDHVKIGKKVIITGGSQVSKNIPDNSIVSSTLPAMDIFQHHKTIAIFHNLPEIYNKVKQIEKFLEREGKER